MNPFRPGMESGIKAEELAKQHLEQQGLVTLTRNFRCRQGEIDLIMRQGKTLVFVEVRYRKSAAFGSPAETVTKSKQQKIITAANYYLTGCGQHDMGCRFDVVAITGQHPAKIEWITDAFQMDTFR